MNDSSKFFICKHCGNMAVLLEDKGVPLVCCGENMTKLEPNSVEASVEKHLPVVAVSGDSINVQIGGALHPMEDKHHISLVYVKTQHGGQCKHLEVGKEPKLGFNFSDDKPIAAYAYCNLHGLWKTEIK